MIKNSLQNESIKLFNLKELANFAKYDEHKLEHINTYYFKNFSLKELLNIIVKNFKIDSFDESFLEKLCLLFQERSENVNDFLSGIEYMISVKEIKLSENASQIIKNTKKCKY